MEQMDASLVLKMLKLREERGLQRKIKGNGKISSNRLVIKLVDNYVAKEFRFNWTRETIGAEVNSRAGSSCGMANSHGIFLCDRSSDQPNVLEINEGQALGLWW